jgi:diguanylate cyclase (GGDEF)-like protein
MKPLSDEHAIPQVFHSGNDRDRIAEDRDRSAAMDDERARERDLRAQQRDTLAEERDMRSSSVDPNASLDRAAARRDRQESANDRARAADNRVSSDTDRILSARERAEYLVDDLTGAHRRAAGLFEMERELLRAKRTDQAFTIAFVDVDGLKAVNDTHGHSAGDDLLLGVVDTIREHVRPYDLVVRYGGDEFLCGLLGIDLVEVSRRFELVNLHLGISSQASVSAGFSELEGDQSLAALIRAADDDLYRRRQRRTVVNGTVPGSATPEADPSTKTNSAPRTLTAEGVSGLLQELVGAAPSAAKADQAAIRNSPSYDWLSQLSLVDPATGFVNRRLLLDRLSQALTRTQRNASHVIAFSVGIRNLTTIYDTYGHTEGDAMLSELSVRLSSVLRNEDTVGRVGGSELVALFTIAETRFVPLLRRRLQVALDEPIRAKEAEFHLSSSIGVAIAKEGEAANDLLKRANRAMSVINNRKNAA